MKISELTGAQLDYWVARAEGVPQPEIAIQGGRDAYSPSENWEQGGPLIDKYDLAVGRQINGPGQAKRWCAILQTRNGSIVTDGDDSLQAICRAVVRIAFGNEVPDVDLLK